MIEPKYIAHALGGHKKNKYINSIDVLEYNYERGHRFFEFDLARTTDNKYVLIHDWQETLQRNFGLSKIPDYNKFMSCKILKQYKATDLDMLLIWLEQHEDAYLFSDVKDLDNVGLVNYVKNLHPKLLDRIIIQIFNFEEYDEVQRLGVKNIVLTLYNIPEATEDEVVRFTREKQLIGVAMPKQRGRSELPQKLDKLGVPSYVHTVNSKKEAEEFTKNKVHGFFTDFLV